MLLQLEIQRYVLYQVCILRFGLQHFNLMNSNYLTEYSRIPLIRFNWDGEPSGYAENPDNWIFLFKIGYIGSLKWKNNFYKRLS